jgi:hypothetical protein
MILIYTSGTHKRGKKKRDEMTDAWNTQKRRQAAGH